MSEDSGLNLSELIRERRKVLGITQTELSDLSEVSVRAISELENGELKMSLNRVMRIFYVLGLQLEVHLARN